MQKFSYLLLQRVNESINSRFQFVFQTGTTRTRLHTVSIVSLHHAELVKRTFRRSS